MKNCFLTSTIRIIISTFCVISLLSSCSKTNNNNPASKLTITSLSKSSGKYNDTVNIFGTGFSLILMEDHVFFNGKAATVINAPTTTQMTVIVPLSAGSGNVSASINGAMANGPVFNYELSYVITVLAGVNNFAGSHDGQGGSATFFGIMALTTDLSGNLYTADSGDGLIRKVTQGGSVTTLAGGGAGIVTLDGVGSAANFSAPYGLVMDTVTGNIYVSDALQHSLIRKIAPPNIVTTLAGRPRVFYNDPPLDGQGANASFSDPHDIVADASGNLYVADYGNGLLRKITPGGTVTTIPGVKISGFVLAIDKIGNLYTTDINTIKKITPTGIVSTIAGSGQSGTADGAGLAASFTSPSGIAVDKSGNLFVLDDNGDSIREITPQGVVTTPFPEGSMTGNAQAITIDVFGNIYIGYITMIRKIALQ